VVSSNPIRTGDGFAANSGRIEQVEKRLGT
jgi:hypothetical protein